MKKSMYINEKQKKLALRDSKGFTLVEVLVAIFILVLTISTLISLSAGSFYNVRYAQNQITGNMLAQEMLEYVRHSRDSAVQRDPDAGFSQWYESVSACSTLYLRPNEYCNIDQFRSGGPDIVFSGVEKGVSPLSCFGEGNRRSCASRLNTFSFNENAGSQNSTVRGPSPLFVYPNGQITNSTESTPPGRSTGAPQPSPFSRGVRFIMHSPDQVEVFVRVQWRNGTFTRFVEQSILLTNW